MALYLVQHGQHLPKEIDEKQGLSEQGIDEVERIADTAAVYGVKIDRILHSEKKRARQTADIFAKKRNVAGVAETGGLKALDDPKAFAGQIRSDENLMLVGHLPFMERMASYLTTGKTDYTVFKFQNGGIVCLDKLPDSDFWAIVWALMPHIG